METKSLPLDCVELKFTAPGVFTGYASTFGNVDAVGDVILPGAFSESLSNRQRPVRMRWNHKGPVIGKWTKLEEDGKGLYVEGELTPGHSIADDVYAGLKHGSLDALSIGYRVPSGGAAKEGRVRNLKRLDLVEISVVEDPANLSALVGDVKQWLDEVTSLKDMEDGLREAFRISRADACALVSRIKSMAHGERDAEMKRAAEIKALFQRFE